MIKKWKDITLPYWFNKKIVLDFYWLIGTKNKRFRVTVWEYHKMLDYDKTEWYSSWWKHFTLWKSK